MPRGSLPQKTFSGPASSALRDQWKQRALRELGFDIDAGRLDELATRCLGEVALAADTIVLLTEEARLTKALYKLAVDAVGYGDFTRAKRGSGTDAANGFLDHGNYLA